MASGSSLDAASSSISQTSPVHLPVFEHAEAPFKPSFPLQRAPSYPLYVQSTAESVRVNDEIESLACQEDIDRATSSESDHGTRSLSSDSEGDRLIGESIGTSLNGTAACLESSLFSITDGTETDSRNDSTAHFVRGNGGTRKRAAVCVPAPSSSISAGARRATRSSTPIGSSRDTEESPRASTGQKKSRRR